MDGAARWSLKGAEALLRLRALRSSGDFAAYWSFHVAQEYQRNHVALYADGNVVPVQGRTQLRTTCEVQPAIDVRRLRIRVGLEPILFI